MDSVHVLISGEVQAVGFRSYVKRTAEQLGLKGWVKNLQDGRVEAVFEGKKQDIEQILDSCRKGLEFSRVDKVDIEWIKPEGLKNFEVRL